MEVLKEDIKENKTAIEKLGDIIRGNGGGIGMRAEVKMNTDFREQIAKDIRKIFFLFLGQGIIVFIAFVIWGIQNMPAK